MSILKKPSAWEIVYSIAMALACLISYAVMTELLNVAVEGHADLVGGMWAAVSTAFVFRDSRQHSLSAGAGRLIATCVSFALCLPYLWFIPTNVAWQQPLLRLFDTVVGIAIGVGGKWIASFAFYKARGEPVQ
jgi:putative flippase GtrA